MHTRSFPSHTATLRILDTFNNNANVMLKVTEEREEKQEEEEEVEREEKQEEDEMEKQEENEEEELTENVELEKIITWI